MRAGRAYFKNWGGRGARAVGTLGMRKCCKDVRRE